MHTIKRFKVGEFTISIHPDQDADCPLSDVEVYYLKKGRHTLGTAKLTDAEMDRIGKRVAAGEVYGLPVYAYVHGSIALSTTPFSCPWDSGRSGWVVVEKDGFTDKEQAHQHLRASLAKCAAWINGEAVGYTVTDGEGTEIDSCWGFYELEYCEEQAREAAMGEVARRDVLPTPVP